jgi:translin
MSEINTKDFSKRLTKYFDGKEEVREKALKLSREISKGSTSIIRRLHSNKPSDLKPITDELKILQNKYKKLKTEMKRYPEVYYSNMVENYIQELAEAIILVHLIKNDLRITKLPDPEKLGLPYTTYLLGLSDVIGEFRRCTLDALRKKELQEAIRYLDAMEALYDFIIDLNYPDRVLPLRRKQDVARALIEKTRGELTFAASEYSLVENITDLKSDLKTYYKKVVRKN